MNNPVNLTDPYGLTPAADVLMGIGWILAAVEPTFVGEALMSYVTMIRAGIAAAKAAEMIMENYGEKGKKNICSGSDNGEENYENPGHHDPSNSGPNPYNRNKSVLPKNHQELWKNSRLASDGNRWTKVGEGKNAVYHRFQSDGNGNWHWNGSTNGVTQNGIPRSD